MPGIRSEASGATAHIVHPEPWLEPAPAPHAASQSGRARYATADGSLTKPVGELGLPYDTGKAALLHPGVQGGCRTSPRGVWIPPAAHSWMCCWSPAPRATSDPPGSTALNSGLLFGHQLLSQASESHPWLRELVTSPGLFRSSGVWSSTSRVTGVPPPAPPVPGFLVTLDPQGSGCVPARVTLTGTRTKFTHVHCSPALFPAISQDQHPAQFLHLK